jgi:hypothetical protein
LIFLKHLQQLNGDSLICFAQIAKDKTQIQAIILKLSYNYKESE